MKNILTIATLLASSLAHAEEPLRCELKEVFNGTVKKSTVIEHNAAGPHGLTNYDIDFATGFVAVSNGNVVVMIHSKADERTFSFYGPYVEGGVVNGTTCLKDYSTCLTVTCR